jgi:hypothetical protein
MSSLRTNQTPAFKAEVALVAVKSDRSTSDLAGCYGVPAARVRAWKKRLLAGAETLFAAGRRGVDRSGACNGHPAPAPDADPVAEESAYDFDQSLCDAIDEVRTQLLALLGESTHTTSLVDLLDFWVADLARQGQQQASVVLKRELGWFPEEMDFREHWYNGGSEP